MNIVRTDKKSSNGKYTILHSIYNAWLKIHIYTLILVCNIQTHVESTINIMCIVHLM